MIPLMFVLLGFDEKALEILRAKKSGNYIVIQMDPNYEATDMVRQKM
jgi:hypothetical protein